MQEWPEEAPEWAKLIIDLDVAEWLKAQADDYFEGNRTEALNATLRAMMELELHPNDPWALIMYRLRTKQRTEFLQQRSAQQATNPHDHR